MNDFPDRVNPSQGDWSISASGDVNGVTVIKELFGVVFLGFLTICLLIALQRAQARNRALLIQLAQQEHA